MRQAQFGIEIHRSDRNAKSDVNAIKLGPIQVIEGVSGDRRVAFKGGVVA